jgi:hypothetical protein
MRAAIVEREELTGDIEHHDRTPVHLNQLAPARRNVIDRGNDVPRHYARPYSFFALPA